MLTDNKSYNVYCDESCHLENDHKNVMTLGAIWCSDEVKKGMFSRIRGIKEKHGLPKDFEIKWTKVSPAKVEFYKEMLDFFFNEPHLHFRAVVIKESNFWHLIQEAYQTRKEDDRIPDLRRCERIRWPRPVIENGEKSVVLLWENTRHSNSGVETNICMWLKEKEYLVVLRKRKEYFLLWTAYPVTKEHTKRKLQKEYEVYKKNWGRHF